MLMKSSLIGLIVLSTIIIISHIIDLFGRLYNGVSISLDKILNVSVE